MKLYRIKQGDHYAKISLFEKIGAMGWKIRSARLKFIFHSDCWWAPPRNADDQDLNKLAGIGYGTNHHNNSVRLAWVPDFTRDGVIRLYGYTYDELKSDPKFRYEFITNVMVRQPCQASIESTGKQYVITVNGVTVRMENTQADPNLCFRLFPYFGGNNTAPQDMTIELEY